MTYGGHLAAAYLALATLVFAACTINALSILDEVARDGRVLPAWQPFGAEYTSFAGTLCVLPIAILTEHALTRSHPVRSAAVAVTASLLFSALHVAIMVGLRHILWWSQGSSYEFDYRADWLYEYRKDALSFLLALTVFAIARRWPRAKAADPPRAASLVLLPNGRRRVEVDTDSLVAVRGGGNYAELIFAGGRTSLLRATLAAVEEALRGHGFRRTHKSWLVALGSIRSARRTPSGDYCLAVGDAVEIPLSRRRAALLDEIRAPAIARQGSLFD